MLLIIFLMPLPIQCMGLEALCFRVVRLSVRVCMHVSGAFCACVYVASSRSIFWLASEQPLVWKEFSFVCILFSDMMRVCHSIWGRSQLVPCTSVCWHMVSRSCSLWSITVMQWTNSSSLLPSRSTSLSTVAGGTTGLHWTLTTISSNRCRYCCCAAVVFTLHCWLLITDCSCTNNYIS